MDFQSISNHSWSLYVAVILLFFTAVALTGVALFLTAHAFNKWVNHKIRIEGGIQTSHLTAPTKSESNIHQHESEKRFGPRILK